MNQHGRTMLLDYILLKHNRQLMHLENELNKLQKQNIYFLNIYFFKIKNQLGPFPAE